MAFPMCSIRGYFGTMSSWMLQKCLSLEGAENIWKLLTPEPSRHGSEAQHPRKWTSLCSQTKKAPPSGHERPNASTGLYMMVMPT